MCMHETLTTKLLLTYELFLIFSLRRNSISGRGAVALGEMLVVIGLLKELK